jgi:DNA polymerase-3 subunit chi
VTRIDFYVLEAGAALSRDRVLCALVGKAYTQGQRVYIHAGSETEAERLDVLLWTFKDVSFLPHQRLDGAVDPETLILIGVAGEPAPGALMINMSEAAPPSVECFERVIEIVDGEPAARRRSRERWRGYSEQGYSLRIERLRGHDEPAAPR